MKESAPSDPPAKSRPSSTPPPESERRGGHATESVPGGASAVALTAAAQKPRPLGMALLAAGKIEESQLRSALTRQSSELLYEVLRWPGGRFEHAPLVDAPEPLHHDGRHGHACRILVQFLEARALRRRAGPVKAWER